MSQALDFPATRRNREPLLEVLQPRLPEQGLVLEIGSGSGQHHVYFAPRFPRLRWQPTDLEEEHLASIGAWQELEPAQNLLPPKRLDLLGNWPVERADVILCFNVVHISPWACTPALFEGAGRVLPSGGRMFTYGPYRVDGAHTAPSNERFEGWLKAQNPDFGVRDMGRLAELADAQGLELEERIPMPANNFTLVFRRR